MNVTAFLLSQLHLNTWNPIQMSLLSKAQDGLEHPPAFLLFEIESIYFSSWDNLLCNYREKNPAWIIVYISGEKS